MRKLTALFLGRKTFFLAENITLTPQQQLVIAAQACLPILNLDLSWYEDWLTVIVFPGEFMRSRREMDSIVSLQPYHLLFGFCHGHSLCFVTRNTDGDLA